MVKVWVAPEAVIKMAPASSVTISASAVLDTEFAAATAVTGVMKDITVTEPQRDADKIDLLGTTSNFQNAGLELKPANMVEVSGTAILPGDEVSEPFIFGSTATAAGGTHTTYRGGQTNQSAVAVLINLDDGTDEMNYAGTNMRVTASDSKVTGADGHWEVTWTLKCLPRDWYGPQFKD